MIQDKDIFIDRLKIDRFKISYLKYTISVPQGNTEYKYQ